MKGILAEGCALPGDCDGVTETCLAGRPATSSKTAVKVWTTLGAYPALFSGCFPSESLASAQQGGLSS